jgi:hypothetical protein
MEDVERGSSVAFGVLKSVGSIAAIPVLLLELALALGPAFELALALGPVFELALALGPVFELVLALVLALFFPCRCRVR